MTTETKYSWPMPRQPWSDEEEERWRDLAAHQAREWSREKYGTAWTVVSVNRGPRNLVVRLMQPMGFGR